MIFRMIHFRTIVACLCLVLAVKGDLSTSNLRGSNVEGEWSPFQGTNDLKTYIVAFKRSNSTTMSIASTTTYSMVESVGGQVIYNYDTVLNGAAVTLTASAADQLKQNNAIDFVVEDGPVSISGSSWGLDRIDQSDYPLDGKYRWENNMAAGAGVNVCVSQSVWLLTVEE